MAAWFKLDDKIYNFQIPQYEHYDEDNEIVEVVVTPDVRTALPPISLTSPAPSGFYYRQQPPLAVTPVLVQPASVEELSGETDGLV